VIADASKALAKAPRNNRALCIRAYGYYLNNNYEAAITDCNQIIEGISGDIEKREKEKKTLWKTACEKIAEAAEATQKAAEAAEATQKAAKAAEATQKAAKAAENAQKAMETYATLLYDSAFAYELLGLIYANIDWPFDSSLHYKQALLYRQIDMQINKQEEENKLADTVPASPLLMEAYRKACLRVKSV
jgi:tetratricopeptide (TPR) repeat protein